MSRYEHQRYRSDRESQFESGPSRNSYRRRSNERYDRGSKDGDNKQLVTQDGVPIVKEKPNFKPSGLLAKESNNINGIALKYTTPKDSINPPKEPTYHLYSFKEGSEVPIVQNLVKSYYLVGRDEKVVDILTDDETCSKQHAVIQFREVSSLDSEGYKSFEIKPYLIDLESSNGTLLNDEEVPTSRYIELKNEDVIKFGDSTTENVLIVS